MIGFWREHETDSEGYDEDEAYLQVKQVMMDIQAGKWKERMTAPIYDPEKVRTMTKRQKLALQACQREQDIGQKMCFEHIFGETTQKHLKRYVPMKKALIVLPKYTPDETKHSYQALHEEQLEKIEMEYVSKDRKYLPALTKKIRRIAAQGGKNSQDETCFIFSFLGSSHDGHTNTPPRDISTYLSALGLAAQKESTCFT